MGGLVRLELRLHDGTDILVQLTRERGRELNLAEGDEVYVIPRNWQVFHEPAAPVEPDYVI